MSSVLVIGCGDLGRRVAARHLERGDAVVGVVRRGESAARLEQSGIQPALVDLDTAPGSVPSARGALVYYFAPPPERGDRDWRLRGWTESLSTDGWPRKVVYVSTSGVYGDRAGAWVDEECEPRPETDRARRRLDAEQTLSIWAAERGVAWIALRVGGIYGPGRLPTERIRSGRPVLRERDCGYTNRIHVEDLASVAVAAGDRGSDGAIYNVSDGRPGNMTEYLKAVADLLRLARPPEISWAEAEGRLSPEMLSYLRESRRLDNSRMLRELGVKLQYPDLRSGLLSCR
jgi:nucleoside-diphosphate-sugar epimerase